MPSPPLTIDDAGATIVDASETDDCDSAGSAMDASTPADASTSEEDAATDASIACASGTHVYTGGCIPDDPIAALPPITECLNGENVVIRIDADDDNGVSPGAAHVVYTTAYVDLAQDFGAGPFVNAFFVVDPVSPTGKGSWEVQFTSPPAQSLGVGNYSPAYPYTDPNASTSAQLYAGATGVGFDGIGAFAISQWANNGGELLSFSGSFWLHTNGHAGLVRGCVHYTVPDAGNGDGG